MYQGCRAIALNPHTSWWMRGRPWHRSGCDRLATQSLLLHSTTYQHVALASHPFHLSPIAERQTIALVDFWRQQPALYIVSTRTCHVREITLGHTLNHSQWHLEWLQPTADHRMLPELIDDLIQRLHASGRLSAQTLT